MQAFLIRVMIAVLTSPQVTAMLKGLITPIVAAAEANLTAEVQAVEDRLVAALEGLPGVILGDATKDVGVLLHEITGTTDDIAGAVKGQVQPLLPTVDSLQSMLTNVIKGLPGGGFLGGILGH